MFMTYFFLPSHFLLSQATHLQFTWFCPEQKLWFVLKLHTAGFLFHALFLFSLRSSEAWIWTKLFSFGKKKKKKKKIVLWTLPKKLSAMLFFFFFLRIWAMRKVGILFYSVFGPFSPIFSWQLKKKWARRVELCGKSESTYLCAGSWNKPPFFSLALFFCITVNK